MAIAELLLLARQHLSKLEPHERRRVVERERRELARLVEKTAPREFASTAMKRLVGVPLRGSRDRP
jgi:hypothetical protein